MGSSKTESGPKKKLRSRSVSQGLLRTRARPSEEARSSPKKGREKKSGTWGVRRRSRPARHTAACPISRPHAEKWLRQSAETSSQPCWSVSNDESLLLVSRPRDHGRLQTREVGSAEAGPARPPRAQTNDSVTIQRRGTSIRSKGPLYKLRGRCAGALTEPLVRKQIGRQWPLFSVRDEAASLDEMAQSMQ